jgi:subtilisin family serine protease
VGVTREGQGASTVITLELAEDLKRAGLTWEPARGDCFAIPGRDLDDLIFYVTDMAIRVAMLHGHPTVMFQGAYEWALDYILLTDVVWLPSEDQLRSEVEALLPASTAPTLRLTRTAGGYVCEITDGADYTTHAGDAAALAYGQALLYLLTRREDSPTERTS